MINTNSNLFYLHDMIDEFFVAHTKTIRACPLVKLKIFVKLLRAVYSEYEGV